MKSRIVMIYIFALVCRLTAYSMESGKILSQGEYDLTLRDAKIYSEAANNTIEEIKHKGIPQYGIVFAFDCKEKGK